MKSRILLFPGSLRKDSHQKALLKYIATVIGENAEIDLLDPSEINLPLFNQDLENNPDIRAEAFAIHQRFLQADAVIIASPEYNGTISPFLKNTLDWVSRLPRVAPPTPSAFRDKILLLCCATTGWTGGIQGLLAARLMLNYMGFMILPEQITVGQALERRYEDTFAFDERFSEQIEFILSKFLQIVYSQQVERITN